MIDLFILSSPRSGSTITRLTLNKLEGLVTLPETHFWVFKEKFQKLSFSKDKARIIHEWLEFYSIKKFPIDSEILRQRLTKEVNDWKEMLEVTIDEYLKVKYPESKKSDLIICEKSPPHVFHLHQIKKDFTQAKFIFIVRDPRDVVASLKTCNWSTSNPLINSLVWRKGIRLVEKSNLPVIVIKYEDFVNNPNSILNNICKLLNISFEAEKLLSATTDDVEQNNYTSANALKPISTEYVGSYEKKLSRPDREQELIEYVCRKEMKKYGYNSQFYRRFNFRLMLIYIYHRFGLFIRRIV